MLAFAQLQGKLRRLQGNLLSIVSALLSLQLTVGTADCDLVTTTWVCIGNEEDKGDCLNIVRSLHDLR